MPLNTNNRLYWACQAVGLARDGSSTFTPIHGLQTVGITTTFNLESLFEIGQLPLYELIENIADVEVTLEKVLDGYPLIYHLATPNASNSTLPGRSTVACILALNVYGETVNSASGTQNAQVTLSGLYCSSIGYNFPVEGFATESVTLVGNNKVWSSAGFTFTGTLFNGSDAPLSLASGTGGGQRREDVIFGSNLTGTNTLLPGGSYGGIPGLTASGANIANSNGVLPAKIQSINITADLGRESLFELGRKLPYFRFVSYPVKVNTEIATITADGDFVDFTEGGYDGFGGNLTPKRILVVTRDGTKIDAGSKNKLTGVTYGGGDAGGGNVTTTFSYSNDNELVVLHLNDPAGFTS